MPVQSEETVKDVATLYLDGDKDAGLPRHRMPAFLDERVRGLCMPTEAKYLTDWLQGQTFLFSVKKDRSLKRQWNAEKHQKNLEMLNKIVALKYQYLLN